MPIARNRVVSCLVGAIAVLALHGTAPAGTEPADVRLRAISDAVEARERSTFPLVLDYTAEIRFEARAPRPGDRWSGRVAFDGRRLVDVQRYTRDVSLHAGREVWQDAEERRYDDGSRCLQVTRAAGENGWVGVVLDLFAGSARMNPLRFGLALESVHMTPISRYLRRPTTRLLPDETLDGVPCARVLVGFDTSTTDRISGPVGLWLDPALGWFPRRIVYWGGSPVEPGPPSEVLVGAEAGRTPLWTYLATEVREVDVGGYAPVRGILTWKGDSLTMRAEVVPGAGGEELRLPAELLGVEVLEVSTRRRRSVEDLGLSWALRSPTPTGTPWSAALLWTGGLLVLLSLVAWRRRMCFVAPAGLVLAAAALALGAFLRDRPGPLPEGTEPAASESPTDGRAALAPSPRTPGAATTPAGSPPDPTPAGAAASDRGTAGPRIDRVAWAEHAPLFQDLSDLMLHGDPNRDAPSPAALAAMARFMTDLESLKPELGIASAQALTEDPRVHARLAAAVTKDLSTDAQALSRDLIAIVPALDASASAESRLAAGSIADHAMAERALRSVPHARQPDARRRLLPVFLFGAREVPLATGSTDLESAAGQLRDAIFRAYRLQLEDVAATDVSLVCRDWAGAGHRALLELVEAYGRPAVEAALARREGDAHLLVRLDLRARMATLASEFLPRVWRVVGSRPTADAQLDRTVWVVGWL